MSEIVLQGYFIQSASAGFVQFSKGAAAPQAMPVHMDADQHIVHFVRGFNCEFFGPVSSCNKFEIIIRRQG